MEEPTAFDRITRERRLSIPEIPRRYIRRGMQLLVCPKSRVRQYLVKLWARSSKSMQVEYFVKSSGANLPLVVCANVWLHRN